MRPPTLHLLRNEKTRVDNKARGMHVPRLSSMQANNTNAPHSIIQSPSRNTASFSTAVISACLFLLISSCTSGRQPLVTIAARDAQPKKTSLLLSIRSDLDLRNQTASERYFGPSPSFELRSPTDVAVDKRGSIYISDSGLGGIAASIAAKSNNRSAKYSFMLVKSDEFGRGRPEGMGYNAELDWLAVADSYLKVVIIYELPSMRRVGSIKSPEFMNPVDVAIDAINRRIYVADSVRDTVLAFDLEGNHIMDIGRPGRDKGGLFRPSSVAVDGSGLLYVVDSFNFRYQVFTPGGQPVFQSGERGNGSGKFIKPHGIALDPAGKVLVSDYSSGEVQYFSGEGAAPTLALGGLKSPAGIYANGNGMMYVAEPEGHRVLVFRLGSQGQN